MADPVLRWLRLPNTGGRSRWLEFAVAMALLGVLVWFAVDRIWAVRIAAERAAVEQAIGSLRNALGIEAFRRSGSAGLAGIAALDGANPIALLERPPPSYVGELQLDAVARVAAGAWYFDQARRVLVYRARFPEAFPGRTPDQVYRVRFVFRDRDGNGRFEPRMDGVRELTLAPVFASGAEFASDNGVRAWELQD